MKIGVLVDNGHVSRWQADALLDLRGCTELIVYNCTNTPRSAKKARHGLYYLLNLFTVRNAYTRSVPVPPIAGAKFRTSDFEAIREGMWQRLPDALLNRISCDAPAVILKFGMGLLRVPDATRLAHPILSYHHGDPDVFRGRPAGFYEVLQDRPVMGQIVQILSDRLDGGRVVAFAETKVHRHSYKATLEEAFSRSRLLINTAIGNALAGRSVQKRSDGPNYRLPGNAIVAGFSARLTGRLIGRVRYGAFVEKSWKVSSALTGPNPPWALPPRSAWRTLKVPAGYSFIADPFLDPSGDGIIVEALRASNGKGELLLIEGEAVAPLTRSGRHYSYPGSIEDAGAHFVVPEIAQWSPPRLYSWKDRCLADAGALDLPGSPRLLDPTLYGHDGSVFLFGNVASEGEYVLRLWHAPALRAAFAEHPASPIRISPHGGRMGGGLFRQGARLFRFGQNFGKAYGDGLLVFEIDTLSAGAFGETLAGTIKFDGVRGPHTLNLREGQAVFDWYEDRVSPLAGVRRLLGRYG